MQGTETEGECLSMYTIAWMLSCHLETMRGVQYVSLFSLFLLSAFCCGHALTCMHSSVATVCSYFFIVVQEAERLKKLLARLEGDLAALQPQVNGGWGGGGLDMFSTQLFLKSLFLQNGLFSRRRYRRKYSLSIPWHTHKMLCCAGSPGRMTESFSALPAGPANELRGQGSTSECRSWQFFGNLWSRHF